MSVAQAVPKTEQKAAYDAYINKCHHKARNSLIPAKTVLEMIDQLRVDLGKIPVSELPADIQRVYLTGVEEERRGAKHTFWAPALIRAAMGAQLG